MRINQQNGNMTRWPDEENLPSSLLLIGHKHQSQPGSNLLAPHRRGWRQHGKLPGNDPNRLAQAAPTLVIVATRQTTIDQTP